MALPKASDLSNPTPDGVLGANKADVLRRELREDITYLSGTDAITSLDLSVSNTDVTIDYTAEFTLGSEVKAELTDWGLTVLASGTNTSKDDTITFSNADQYIDPVRLDIFVINSGGFRVSERIEGLLLESDNVTSLVTGEEVKHPDTPGWVDAGSEFDLQKRQKERTQQLRDDLSTLESHVDDLFNHHHKFTHKGIQSAERHIDLISGGLSAMSDDPLQSSDYSDAKTVSAADSFTADRSDWSIGTAQSGFTFNKSTDNIQFYDSPGGSRTSGDASEKVDLENSKPVSGTVTVYDETQEQDVTYASDSEIDTRISEIETIVDDFNNSSTLQEMYQDRIELIDLNTNRINGFAFTNNLLSDAKTTSNIETDKDKWIFREAGKT